MKRHELETEKLVRKVSRLRDEIRRHDYLYYALDSPEISDEQYDRLFNELRRLEAAHPEFITPDSPTQRVAGTPSPSFPEVRHLAPCAAWTRQPIPRLSGNLIVASNTSLARLTCSSPNSTDYRLSWCTSTVNSCARLLEEMASSAKASLRM